MSRGSVLIMAGGTGGHVFPALALARVLRERSYDVVWLGTRRGIEARIVPAEQIPVEWISVGGLRGKGIATLLLAPFKLVLALWQSLRVMWRHKPLVVVGLGGFVTGPGGIAAWLTRRPLVIHEQNAIAGFTNRQLSRFARNVLEAFPGSFGPGSGARDIGNPVRSEFFRHAPPAERYAARSGAIRVLVVGGSLGAQRLNGSVPQALGLLQQGGHRFEIRHQCGERSVETTRAAFASAGVTAEVLPFIDDISAAYAAADLVICRAGALTISELAAVGVAAILVPFPAAVDDHQTFNARYLVDAGAAVLIADRELSGERLAQEIATLCADRARLSAMAERARRLARPDATQTLAAVCEQAAGVAA